MHRKLVLAVALIAALVGLTACGAGPNGPQVSVEDAWARPVPAAGGNGAVYARLVNAGDEAARLVGGQSPVAGGVEIHQTTMEEGVMKMQHIPGLEIPPKGEILLRPGDYHVMLIDVGQSLVPGDTLPITLRFEKSGEMEMDVEVREMK